MNILQVLESATGYLETHGVESPRRNAEHLLSHVLRCKRLDLYLLFDRPVSEAERAPLRDLVKRRIAGEPLQHLLGEWDFYGRTFGVDARALIPRPETELLVEIVLKTTEPNRELRVLDCGTGSGCIALTLAIERPGWHLTAVDISGDALSLARENHKRHDSPANVDFFEADFFPGETVFDLIVANLPYIPTAEIPTLSKEVQRDPLLALDGGEDGLDVYRGFLGGTSSRLEAGGRIFLEFASGQENALESMLGGAGFSQLKVHKDHQGLPRLIEGTK